MCFPDIPGWRLRSTSKSPGTEAMRFARFSQIGSWRFYLSSIHNTNCLHWRRMSSYHPRDWSKPLTPRCSSFHLTCNKEVSHSIPCPLSLRLIPQTTSQSLNRSRAKRANYQTTTFTKPFTKGDHVMTDLPPKELDLFKHGETLETFPKGNEHLVKDAQCLLAIA